MSSHKFTGHLFNPKRPHLRACIWMHGLDVKYGFDRDYIAAKQPPLNGTPLYYAVFCGFSELAECLITTHADDPSSECYRDRTPLHVASQQGHVDAVRVLLDHRANLNSQDDTNWMPLHFASYEGKLKVVQLLVEHGAPVNARSVSNHTSVYPASEWRHYDVIQLLLKYGAKRE